MATAADQGAWRQFLGELFRADLYKKSQGRTTRQVTFAAIAAVVILGAWRLSIAMIFVAQDANESVQYSIRYGIPVAVVLFGLWAAFRAMNVPRIADFLIAVEAEMSKVSWPTRDVLFRSSAVVMFTMFALTGMLFVYDLLWSQLLRMIGVGA